MDEQIVELLSKDGRMSYTDLGKATGLSTSAIHQRVRRLEERQVITGYRAVVDPEQAGLPLAAFIAIAPSTSPPPTTSLTGCGTSARSRRATRWPAT
ncbi:Lrp/AsnC family transcriptional regulator [Arsenicicoccus piscis]|uniref:HTH asnC-type domain-containing protein n=1 Tax=Arsenicicoccus piscis TaxID=673954 RepID=A0ABQ6HTZ9_9MICO|nr:hypothetical protein GCM10025862_40210 [Arsenicicoccus piscis]